MNRIRFFAVLIMLMFALGARAQQAPPGTDQRNGVPGVEEHLKLLSAKLELTADQQDKARPILQQMHDGAQKLADDPNLSQEERMARMRPLHLKADKELRVVLNADQQKKLDQLEQEAHMDLHGNPDGKTPPESAQH